MLVKFIAHVYVRGLPHAHFLLILDECKKLKTLDDHDKVVRVEILDPIIESSYIGLVSNI